MGAKARPIDAMPWNGSVDIDIRSTAFSNALLWNWIAIENIQPWDLRKTFMSEMKTKTVSNESTFPKRRWNLSTLVDLRCSLHLAEAPNLFLKGQRQSLLERQNVLMERMRKQKQKADKEISQWLNLYGKEGMEDMLRIETIKPSIDISVINQSKRKVNKDEIEQVRALPIQWTKDL